MAGWVGAEITVGIEVGVGVAVGSRSGMAVWVEAEVAVGIEVWPSLEDLFILKLEFYVKSLW